MGGDNNQRDRGSNEFGRGLVRIRFQLAEDLALEANSAQAYIVRRSASTGAMVVTETTINVFDAFGIFTGEEGDYGYAIWWTDGKETNGGRFEIFVLNPGSIEGGGGEEEENGGATIKYGYTQSTIFGGGSTLVTIWNDTGPTGESLLGFDVLLCSGEQMDEGTKVILDWHDGDGNWKIIAASCCTPESVQLAGMFDIVDASPAGYGMPEGVLAEVGGGPVDTGLSFGGQPGTGVPPPM